VPREDATRLYSEEDTVVPELAASTLSWDEVWDPLWPPMTAEFVVEETVVSGEFSTDADAPMDTDTDDPL
jgi:hypothetical protein